MAFPTITESHGALICFGLPADATFGTPVPPNAFLPVADSVAQEDPGWFTSAGLPTSPPHTAPDAPLSDPAVTPEEVPSAVPNSDH